MSNEDEFTSFACKACKTEIEASLDMIGQETECPACGARITVPDNRSDDVVRHSDDGRTDAQLSAMKSRTIRIELPDL